MPELIVFGTFIIIAMTMLLSEGARTAGMGLFRHVADSYLVMFIDTMSMAIVCF
ncbi:MAG: hypothetical protein CFH10_01670 [Alphaproteobacteria bacterium MarineAlpha4_Bin2]|nr:MAG: hypothetical protein CFH10_01670 [Alphaproteobacteria bacterium MarineAlpha4_Bin2]